MKKLLLFAVLILCAVATPAQQITPPLGEVGHLQGGVYFAPAYAQWQSRVISGNSTTGSGSVIIISAPPALPDGYVIPLTSNFPTSTNFAPISISDANPETFTPTAVSIGACPIGGPGPISAQCITITGSISNTHGIGAYVSSGDSGILEAITDASANGGGLVYWATDTGVVTLNTGGLTTTTTAFVPKNFISMGASARVTTTITTSTNWAVGISGTTSAFCTANSTLTAGTTCLANMNSPATVGTSLGVTAVLITVTGANAGAGAVKSRVWGYTAAQASN